MQPPLLGQLLEARDRPIEVGERALRDFGGDDGAPVTGLRRRGLDFGRARRGCRCLILGADRLETRFDSLHRVAFGPQLGESNANDAQRRRDPFAIDAKLSFALERADELRRARLERLQVIGLLAK